MTWAGFVYSFQEHPLVLILRMIDEFSNSNKLQNLQTLFEFKELCLVSGYISCSCRLVFIVFL